MRDDTAVILFQSFLQEALVGSSGMDWDVHSLISIQYFHSQPQLYPPSKAIASPFLQGAMKNGFGEAVVVCDMPKPCKFPSLDSCKKCSLWTHKEVDFDPNPVAGLVLQVGDAEKFPHALGFEGLDPFLTQQAWSMFHSHRTGWR